VTCASYVAISRRMPEGVRIGVAMEQMFVHQILAVLELQVGAPYPLELKNVWINAGKAAMVCLSRNCSPASMTNIAAKFCAEIRAEKPITTCFMR
jgi:hypothetical protein